MKLRDVFAINGKLKRFEYASLGFLFVAIKYNIDRLIAFIEYDKVLYPTDYIDFLISPDYFFTNPRFIYILAFTAVPFIGIGTLFTIKRLRDADLPKWMVAFFFLPFLNLLFFALLCLLPSEDKNIHEHDAHKRKWLDRFIPKSDNGSAALSILLTSILSVAAISFCIYVMNGYGSSMFLGIPFVQGMSAALIYGYHTPRSLKQCIYVAILSMVMIAVLLLVLAIEGVICIAMAAPLGLIIAAAGAIAGFAIQNRKANTSLTILVLFGTIPLLSGIEHSSSGKVELRKVTTRIVINRSKSEIWNQLITFNEMQPPSELMFKSGIAYPIKAELDGKGVGSIRKCWFTTGAFIEPIKIWDEPNLLEFSVDKVPPPLIELSIYDDLHLPHLNGYFTSERGQFKLTAISQNKTLLQGTTWYRHKIWPGYYWTIWSDYILHKIHLRVLNHIKNQTERN